MADYSQYATPAAEWVEFQKTLPPAVPPTATVFEARDAFNASRAKAHKEFYGVAGMFLEQGTICLNTESSQLTL